MKTPFWWQRQHPIAWILLPISIIWYIASQLRIAFVKPETLSIPVWCVGNATAGGGGKTPFCLYLGKALKEEGVHAYFISRGYGGQLKGPVLVNDSHTAEDVGDEALLLARQLPTVVARKRIDAAKYAQQLGAKWLVMDDGLQYPHIHKNKTFLLMKGNQPLGNGLWIPSGPLRQPLEQAINISDVIVQVDADHPITVANKTVWQAKTSLTIPSLPKSRVVAFAGIAHPLMFKQSLMAANLEIVDFVSFADHHPYRKREIDRLMQKATQLDAALVTTEKDWVRISEPLQQYVIAIKQTLQLQ